MEAGFLFTVISQTSSSSPCLIPMDLYIATDTPNLRRSLSRKFPYADILLFARKQMGWDNSASELCVVHPVSFRQPLPSLARRTSLII
ncbi:hypothetical protein BKA82DRAFT_997031 [Pisolithus tinctorius]|uniref:Uncharacterized protein n=1 Tax=Pisolithus tinctorius Marx 270 TaxID=870435 RepID=A0A0C3JID2_PISTI|nr:hypothetical protein BKA82DRAFT_997031 [Pisolithus tinctorius]KIO08823.1 hypothetical protein M404DRAFT_997031 [Pisolithus tinctorius Marx 270]